MLTLGYAPSPPDAGAAALVRRLTGLRRWDRLSAAEQGAAIALVLTGAALTAAGLIHRHLAALQAPSGVLILAATTVAAGAALPALRSRSLAQTARRHDRRLDHDQLLPAALDAALGRRPGDTAVRALVIRRGLERLARQGARHAPTVHRPLLWFFGAAGWLAALLLLAGPGATTAMPALYSPQPKPEPAHSRTVAVDEGHPLATTMGAENPPRLSTTATRAAGPSGAHGDAPERTSGVNTSAMRGSHGASGTGRGGASVTPRQGPANDRPTRWEPVTVQQPGTVAGPGASGTPAVQPGGATLSGRDSVGVLLRPLRALSPADRLLVDAFLTTAPPSHD